jgi:hypothetical protein
VNIFDLFVVIVILISGILKSLHVLFMKPRLGRSSLWLMKRSYADSLGVSFEDSVGCEIEKRVE